MASENSEQETLKKGLFSKIAEAWNGTSDQSLINKEIDLWIAAGGLRNTRELKKRFPYHLVKIDELAFVTPFGDRHLLAEIKRLGDEMKREIFVEIPHPGTVCVLLVPESKFLPPNYHGFAYEYGQRFIADLESEDRWITVAHEFTHVWLAQRYGPCLSSMVSEGAAVYFTRKRFPQGELSNYDQYQGINEVVNLTQEGQIVGLSPVQMLEKRGVKLKPEETYLYSYRFGGYFMDYLATTFGKELLLRFYQMTCKYELYDSRNGHSLIRNGKIQKGVKEKDLVSQALRSTGLNPDEVEEGFDKHIKLMTR